MDSTLKTASGTIRKWQLDRKLSDEEMLKQFAGLGSVAVYRDIIAGRFDDLDTDHWSEEYAAVIFVMDALADAEEDNNPLYDDLSTVMSLRRAVARVLREKGNNRCVMVQGPTGSGKSKAALLLKAKYGARIVLCEANELWKGNITNMLADILRAMGTENPPTGANAKLLLIIERLNAGRRCLIIDEAHHLSVGCINLIKTLINRTPGEIVLLAMGKLWSDIEKAAYQEARQLTQNRLSERIRFDGVRQGDAEILLQRRLDLDVETARKAAAHLLQHTAAAGNLGFVHLVCRKARELAGKSPVTFEIVQNAASRIVATR